MGELSTKERIIEYLRRNPYRNSEEVRNDLGLTKHAVNHALRQLVDAGVLKSLKHHKKINRTTIGFNEYRLSDKQWFATSKKRG